MPDSVPLIDMHLHLQDPRFDGIRSAALERAKEAGIGWFVSNGTSEDDWEELTALAEDVPNVIPCFGLHPWRLAERSADWVESLRRRLDRLPSAVGEIGLDRWIEPRDESLQESVFLMQLEIARDKKRPVVIHCLKAWDRLLKLLSDFGRLDYGFMLHAYSGPSGIERKLSDLGAYFSFGPALLNPKRNNERAILAKVPLDRLLIETDAPDFLPPPGVGASLNDPAGKPLNLPENLRHVAAEVACILQQSEETLREKLFANCASFLSPIKDLRHVEH